MSTENVDILFGHFIAFSFSSRTKNSPIFIVKRETRNVNDESDVKSFSFCLMQGSLKYTNCETKKNLVHRGETFSEETHLISTKVHPEKWEMSIDIFGMIIQRKRINS